LDQQQKAPAHVPVRRPLRHPVLPAILAAIILTGLPAAATHAVAGWPVGYDVDLSSGFGDYRFGHFHFGIDIRTGGVTGKEVLAPVDGYVWRLRTSYTGYGKVLYLRGNDGCTYVMAHLQDFNSALDRRLKAAQVSAKRYYQDLYFPEDSVPVKKGELLAYSGQTGSGAPHLHFEKRAGDIPLNPLSHGYRLADKTPPVITRLGLRLTDDHSVFPDGSRKMWVPVVAGAAGTYTIDTGLYFNSSVGLLVDCYDLMRSGGMKQAVYRLALSVDGRLWHESVFDSAYFETNTAVSLEYDLLEAVAQRKHVRRLYREPGNDYAGCRPHGPHGGLIGCATGLAPGPHDLAITAEDAFGNRSELRFRVVLGPGEFLYGLDSTVRVAADTTDFYFTASEALATVAVDSIVLYVGRGDRWGWTPDGTIERLDGGRLKVRAGGYKTRVTPLRLYLFTEEGGVIADGVFNGLRDDDTGGKFETSHELTEDGLLIKITSLESSAYLSRVDLFYRGKLLGTEYGRMLTPKRYVCLVRPQAKYARIDRYQAVLSHDPARAGRWSDSLNIVAAGIDSTVRAAFDQNAWLDLPKESFFAPVFLELKRNAVVDRSPLALNSDHYLVLPETFPTRTRFAITYHIPYDVEPNRYSGLCWLDKNTNRWVWLENSFDDDRDVLTATAGGGGSFGAVFDYETPRISNLSLREGGVYQNRRPAVNFVLEDTLSGIADDRNIVIELDGEWLIPEYEPETGRVHSRPLAPLAPGEHYLSIEATDRVGNKTGKYLRFRVAKAGGGDR